MTEGKHEIMSNKNTLSKALFKFRENALIE